MGSLEGISDANDGGALLSDLSNGFNIRIANADGNYSAKFSILHRDVNYPDSALNVTCPMERESVQYVLKQFKQMPRWW